MVADVGPPRRKSNANTLTIDITKLEDIDEVSNTSTNSETNESRRDPFMARASAMLFEMPAMHLKRLKDAQGMNSLQRETKHFSDNTTLHGPKRIYYGKGWSTLFWVTIFIASIIFLLVQVGSLLQMYFSQPIRSEVSFLLSDDGMEFPTITVCNFNPIRKSYVSKLMRTTNFSAPLLDYLIKFNMYPEAMYGDSDPKELEQGDQLLRQYQKENPGFTVDTFFMDGGFECADVLKLCSFAGRQFNCCDSATPLLTNMGKCHELKLWKSKVDWMKKQRIAGVNGGIQLILDTHLEEEFDGTGDDPDPIFMNNFENGFRYFVHSKDTAYFASGGISASPSSTVYSALTTNKYTLLEKFGSCQSKWNEKIESKMTIPYTSANCIYVCQSEYFYNTCGCTPAVYNIEDAFEECTPYQTYMCMNESMLTINDNGQNFAMPSCKECRMECESTVFHAYNSYGRTFSNGALKWMSSKSAIASSIPHMKANYLAVMVFFSDMSFTEFIQSDGMTFTEMLSDIGGNMGMFLGMSLITFFEVIMYLSKISWIGISRRRREYMYEKKRREEEKEKQLEETIDGVKNMRSRKRADTMGNTRELVRRLRKGTVNSIRSAFHPMSRRNSSNADTNSAYVPTPVTSPTSRVAPSDFGNNPMHFTHMAVIVDDEDSRSVSQRDDDSNTKPASHVRNRSTTE